MKKLVCVLLALVMVLAMAACGSKSEAPATQAAEKTGNAETTAVAAPADESGIARAFCSPPWIRPRLPHVTPTMTLSARSTSRWFARTPTAIRSAVWRNPGM